MHFRGTLLQPWNWHTPRIDDSGKNLWQRLERDAPCYAKLRFTALWLPPASKGVGGEDDVGYGIEHGYEPQPHRHSTSNPKQNHRRNR